MTTHFSERTHALHSTDYSLLRMHTRTALHCTTLTHSWSIAISLTTEQTLSLLPRLRFHGAWFNVFMTITITITIMVTNTIAITIMVTNTITNTIAITIMVTITIANTITMLWEHDTRI